MWNRQRIKPPPVCELKTRLTESDRDLLVNAKKLLEDDIQGEVLRDHITVLQNEHYVVSRFIYRIKNQFRREKSLSDIQRIVKCLKRLQAIEITTVMEKMVDCLNFQQSLSESQVYLISRQTMEYYLIRLMGISALLAQAGKYCQDAFMYVARYLNLGHLVPQNVVLFAAASRIWFLTKSLCLKVCDWYQLVLGCLFCFPLTQVKWMPDDTTLPANLMEWLIAQGFLIHNEEIDKQMSDQLSCAADQPQTSPGGHLDNVEEDVGEVVARVIPSNSKTSRAQGDHLAPKTVETDNKIDKQLHPVAQRPPSSTVELDNRHDNLLQSNEDGNAVSRFSSKPFDDSRENRLEQTLPETESNNVDIEIQKYLESSLETEEKIKQFQSDVKSGKVELAGTTYTISKVKKKKILAILKIMLEPAIISLKMRKRKRIISSKIVPKLTRIMRVITHDGYGK